MTDTPAVQVLRLATPELRRGDLVLAHGMRVQLDTDPAIWTSDGDTVYAWVGTVENADQVVADGHVPRSYITRGEWNDHTGRVEQRHDRWTIQGNHRAHWNVLRP